MQFSVEIPDGKGGEIPLWKVIPEWNGTQREITATGRQLGEGDYFANAPEYAQSGRVLDAISVGKLTLYNSHDNPRYRVGQVRKLQPGRGKPSVWYRKQMAGAATVYQYAHELQFEHTSESYATADKGWLLNMGFRPVRIRIKSMVELDVREMTDAQAQRTGFPSAVDYLMWWVNQYLKAHKWTRDDWEYHKQHPELWMDEYNHLYAMVYIGFEFEGDKS